jgi:hypothetical protein
VLVSLDQANVAIHPSPIGDRYMNVRSLALICFIALTSACYHATIDTGLTPSTVTIEKPWASGWILGLVPPSPVKTAQKCPNGVAKIDTQLSFLNQLVSFLTLSIYTPMDIKVTCAQGRTSSLPMIKSGPDKAAAFQAAVRVSMETKQPVLLSY